MTIGAIISAVIALVAAALGAGWYHKRAVITAEQRGRLAEIEKHAVIHRAVKLQEARGRAELIDAKASLADSAKRRLDPVDEREVAAWAGPPKEPPS